MAHKSVASTSLDRSAANLALTMTTAVLSVVLGLVSRTRAVTVLHVSHARTAASRASVDAGLRGPGVRTPSTPNHSRRPLPVDLDSASTVADV